MTDGTVTQDIVELVAMTLFLTVTAIAAYWVLARLLMVETPRLDRFIAWIRRK